MTIEAIKNWCNWFLFRSEAKTLEISRDQGLKWRFLSTHPPPFPVLLSFETVTNSGNVRAVKWDLISGNQDKVGYY